MEHAAVVLKKDPLEIRKINMYTHGLNIKDHPAPKGENLVDCKIIPLLKEKATIEARKDEIKAYNGVSYLIFQPDILLLKCCERT